ncbi:MAG: TauD/TfdA family dioxygenase [Bdellovibrionaceae bacterium]|nr:TauD/TfdA family dioxygenase [Bdellovibrionales bacterium]MCB9083505.1 TauD/TfdA family dioxygenase [Pseudobdellovibrionaceae bacterium]
MIERLSNIGLEFKCQLAPDQDDLIREIGYSAATHKFVLLRQQTHLTAGRFVDITKKFGLHAPQDTWANHKEHPEIFRVTNKVIDGEHMGWFGDRELLWHSNGVLHSDPEDCVAIWCVDPAQGTGGDTWFNDNQLAYEDLPDSFRRELEQLHCIYRPFAEIHGNQGFYNFDDFEAKEFEKMANRIRPGEETGQKANWIDQWQTTDGIVKKLVVDHPVTGEKGLYFPFTMIASFKELSQAEGKKVFDRLVEHVIQDKYVYKHKWSKGDLVFSDQVHSIHKRTPFTGIREVFRTTFWYNLNAPQKQQARASLDAHLN